MALAVVIVSSSLFGLSLGSESGDPVTLAEVPARHVVSNGMIYDDLRLELDEKTPPACGSNGFGAGFAISPRLPR